MSDVKWIEARFLALEGVEGTHENRDLWQRSLKQHDPLYDSGRLLIFKSWVTMRSMDYMRDYSQKIAATEGWELVDLYEKR